jgi:hypothetical protein
MKVRKIRETVVKEFEIDFGNDVLCNYTTKNGRLSNYHFTKNNIHYEIVENIDEVNKVAWNVFHKTMKVRKITKISDLKNFNDFDKLFTRNDTLLFDINGKVQYAVFYLSDSFFSIYCNVKRKEDVESLKERLKTIDEVFDVEDVEIPYYNGGGDTIQAMLRLPSETIEKLLKNTDKKYIDDYMKIEIIEELLNDGKKLRVPDYEVEDNEENGHCTCW